MRVNLLRRKLPIRRKSLNDEFAFNVPFAARNPPFPAGACLRWSRRRPSGALGSALARRSRSRAKSRSRSRFRRRHRARSGSRRPASAENQKMIALFGGEYHDAAAEQFVNGILLKLAQGGRQSRAALIQVTLLNSPVVSAFAMPPHDACHARPLALANDALRGRCRHGDEIGHIIGAMPRSARKRKARRAHQPGGGGDREPAERARSRGESQSAQRSRASRASRNWMRTRSASV